MVLYFTAAWCGPCKTFKPIVQEVQANMGINVNYVDIDVSPELVMKYGITSVPTLIIEHDGNTLYRKTGIMSKSDLIQVMRQHTQPIL